MSKQDEIIEAVRQRNADRLYELLRNETELSLNYSSRGAEGARDVGNDGAKVVAQAWAKGLRLTQITFWDTGIGDEGAQALSEVLQHDKHLKLIRFSYNKIGDIGAGILGKALVTNTTLETLDLGANDSITDHGAIQIAEALLKNNNLKFIHLGCPRVTTACIPHFIEALQKNNTSLIDLWKDGDIFSKNEVLGKLLQRNKNLANILSQLSNPELSELDLSSKGMGDLEAKAIANKLKINRTLTHLNLSSNDIDAEGAKEIAEALKVNRSLTRLNLTHNRRIGNEGAKALANVLKSNINSTLTELFLNQNEIGLEGAIAIAEAIKVNLSLAYLNLWENKIDDEGAIVIADALKTNITLTSLILNNNKIGIRGIRALIAALEKNYTITCLNIIDKNDPNVNEEIKKLVRDIDKLIERNLNIKYQPLYIKHQPRRGTGVSIKKDDVENVQRTVSRSPSSAIEARGNELKFIDAVLKEDFETADKLLQEGVPVDARTNQGSTVFQEAVLSKKFRSAEWLLKRGAQIDIHHNQNNYNAFQFAVSLGKINIAEWLLQHGAQIDAKDKTGWTIFQFIVLHYDDNVRLSVAEWLLNNGASIDVIGDQRGWTVFQHAIVAKKYVLAEWLLQHGAQVDAKDKNGYTALQQAISEDQINAVKWLLEHNAAIPNAIPENIDPEIFRLLENTKKSKEHNPSITAPSPAISLATLQHQVLQDLNPQGSDNNNLPASQKSYELTEKELFNKALEESKKTYEQLLQTTIEDFTQSMAQDKLLLEQRMLEEDKQKKVLEDQIQKLEAELQKHVQDERSTSDVIQQKLQIQKAQLREFKIKQRILWKEHQIKVKQKRMLERFQNSPNLILYYRTIQVCIQQLFISSSAGSGGKVTVESGGAADKTQQGLEFFGDLCNVVPLVGAAVNFILKWGIGKPVEKIDSVRQENSVKNIASLLTLTELKEINESVAQKLTLWYEPVLQNLATLEDEKKMREDEEKRGGIAKIKAGLKDRKEEVQQAVLNQKPKHSACEAAEFAITWALDELEEGNFDLKQPLDDQIVLTIITKKASYNSDKTPSLLRKTNQIKDDIAIKISKALGKKTVKTKTGETWHLWEMYSECGIKTETEIYGNRNSTIYGYCNGIDNEEIAAKVAEKRGLLPQGENRKYHSKEENPKKSPTSPAHHRQLQDVGTTTKRLGEKLDKTEVTTQINIEGVKKKNSELEAKVEKLEKEKSELETKVEKHEQELKEQKLQHQKEIEKIKDSIAEEVQKQFQAHFSQAAIKSTGTPFWNGSVQTGSALSQPQRTPQTSKLTSQTPPPKGNGNSPSSLKP